MIAGNHQQLSDVIRHHWNARADTFEQHGRHNAITSAEQHRAWLDQLAQWAGPAPRKVLDVGCGTGVLSIVLAELGHNVTGIDFAAKMIAVAKEKAAQRRFDIKFRVEDAANVSDADQTYDIIIGRHVIWTLPDPMCGLREWKRILRPNGRLVLIESTFANNQPRPAPNNLVKILASKMSDAALTMASYIVGRKHWRLYARQYRVIQAQLPFSGGAPADRLLHAMQQQGLCETRIEPLMDPALWGETPPYPRYAVTGIAGAHRMERHQKFLKAI
jgi:ubiquinone/menaquinone biosynthesis C-methylase UbiE